MVSARYCRLMARYNSWQNRSLITAADGLSDADRWLDRGAFFGSIAATLNHLYWADGLMLRRIGGAARADEPIVHSLSDPSDWDEFKALRLSRDAQITRWAGGLKDRDLHGMMAWQQAGASKPARLSRAQYAMAFFNHQTHHRGQIHAMLTAAGTRPGPTDLHLLP